MPPFGYKRPGNALFFLCLLVIGEEQRQKTGKGPVPYGCGQQGACMLVLSLALKADGDKSNEPKRYSYSLFLHVFPESKCLCLC